MKISLLKFKNKRQIKTDILFQSISTIIITVFMIVLYSYVKNTDSIIKQSEKYLKSSSRFISGKLMSALDNAENIVNAQVPFLENLDLKDYAHNMKLYQSFDSLLKAYPYLTTLYYGTPTGFFVEYGLIERVRPFLTSVDIAVPDSTQGVVKIVSHDDSSQKSEVPEQWAFILENTKILTTPISTQQTEYDPRKRGWYKQAIKTQDLIWTDVYVFKGSLKNEIGITTSRTIVDSAGVPLGVFSADMTLKSFKDYLVKNKPSKNGNIFIIDNKSQIIAASSEIETVLSSTGEADLTKIGQSSSAELKAAAKEFKTNSLQQGVVFFTENNKDYIALKTPFPKKLPGEWSMVVVAPLDDFVGIIKETTKGNLYFSIVIGLLAALSSFYLARSISRPLKLLSQEAKLITDLDFTNTPPITSGIREISELSTTISALKNSIHSFSYYVPKSLVKRLLHKKNTITLGGHKKNMTLFFSDIEGFTTVSEGMSPERLSIHLCDYFDALGKIIISHEGTIDKYIGDSVMAFWGAPITDRHHPKNACLTALLCQKKLTELNTAWENNGLPVLKTRIGIHTGDAIVGNIGSTERMNYTVIGDSVNLCSRLEGLNKYYGTKIIISQSVVDVLKNQCYVRALDSVVVKGKTESLKIYELVGLVSDDPLLLPTQEVLFFNKEFESGFTLYFDRKFEEALTVFKRIDETLRKNDLSVVMYINRCAEYIKNPPPKEWDGIYRLTGK